HLHRRRLPRRRWRPLSSQANRRRRGRRLGRYLPRWACRAGGRASMAARRRRQMAPRSDGAARQRPLGGKLHASQGWTLRLCHRAWTDVFASWRRDFLAKRAAGMDVELEIEEGRNLLADLKVRNSDQARLIRDIRRKPDVVEDPAPLLSEDLAAA